MMSIATSPIEEDTEINILFSFQKRGYNSSGMENLRPRPKAEEIHLFANIYHPAEEFTHDDRKQFLSFSVY